MPLSPNITLPGFVTVTPSMTSPPFLLAVTMGRSNRSGECGADDGRAEGLADACGAAAGLAPSAAAVAGEGPALTSAGPSSSGSSRRTARGSLSARRPR